MKKHVVVINFKKISSDEAVRVCEKLNQVDESLSDFFQVVLGVQLADVAAVCKSSRFDVFGLVPGTAYGSDSIVESLPSINNPNFRGLVMNHPDHKLSHEAMERYTQELRNAGLDIIACSSSITEAAALSKYRPNFIGLEIKEIIGKDISFSNYCPEVLHDAVAQLPTAVLIGGGIRSSRDLGFVIKNGGAGVLVSSAVVNSSEPAQALNNLLEVD